MRKTLSTLVLASVLGLGAMPVAGAAAAVTCQTPEPGVSQTLPPCPPTGGEACDQAWVTYYGAQSVYDAGRAAAQVARLAARADHWKATANNLAVKVQRQRHVIRHDQRVIRHLRRQLAAANAS